MSTEFSKVDSLTGADIVVDYAHHEVHGKSAFRTSAVDEAMGNADTIELCFKTPAGTKRAHLTLEFATLVGVKVEVLSGVTWDTGTGAQNAIINRFQEASPESSMILEDTTSSFVANDAVVLNPDNLAGGTMLEDFYAWGVKNQAAAGGGRGVAELILEPDTLHAVVLTAIGASNKGHLTLNWYEHTDA